MVELLVASMLLLIIMGAVATLFGEFGKSVADGRAMADLGARTRSVAWRLRQDLAGLTCPPTPFLPVEAGAGYLTTDGTSPATNFLALTTAGSGTPFRGRIKEMAPPIPSPGFEEATGFESPTAEVVWFVQPTNIFKNRQLYNLHRRQLLVAATPEAGVFRNDIFGEDITPTPGPGNGYPGESDLSFGAWPVPVDPSIQHANSLGDLTKPDRRWIARPRAEWGFTYPTSPVGGPNRKGEDVILSNVLSFDVKIATQSGNSTNTYPLAFGNSTFNTLPDSTLAALPPLRALEVTIKVLEPITNEERVISVVHSFGQDRNQYSE